MGQFCKGWGKEGKDRPPVIPGAPSLWAINVQRRALSLWSQSGTTPSAVEFLDHGSFRVEREGGDGEREDEKGEGLEGEGSVWGQMDESCNLQRNPFFSTRPKLGPRRFRIHFSRLLFSDHGPDIG